MKKCIIIMISLVTLFCCWQHGYCSEQTPEQLVRDFYKWFFENDKEGKIAENNDGILNFISKDTIENVRKEKCSDIDYFRKVGSESYKWTSVHTAIGSAVLVARDIFIVPVDFVFKDGEEHISVVVVLQKENGKLLITKIMDQHPYL